jgi:hypothetical protein
MHHEPKTYASTSKHSHWIDAMNCELHALASNNTWSLVELHVGKRVIGSKWVYKVKYKSD